jgi:hypothetical protein
MKCAVCGTEGARALTTVGGTDLGHAHEGTCQGLLWEAHFVRVTGGAEHEHAEVLWMWRRQRAHVAGVAFAEPAPTSPAEDEIETWVQVNELQDVAKELS